MGTTPILDIPVQACTELHTLFLVRLLLLADPKKDDYVYESSTFHYNLPWTQCVARNLKYDLGEVSSVHPVLHAPERMPPIFPLPLSSKSHPSHAFQNLAHTMAAL
jgi:hypothetical protein